MQQINIFWFRRDLRLEDNAGLYYALKSNRPVVPIFIFDTNILNKLDDKEDKRIVFIHAALEKIQSQLVKLGSSLEIYYGEPLEIYKKLLAKYSIDKVYANHDYELYARERDSEVEKLLNKQKITLHTYKDQVVFEKDEVLKDDGKPYTVFTPYSRKWKATLNEFYTKSYPTKRYHTNFYLQNSRPLLSIEEIGFKSPDVLEKVKRTPLEEVIKNYTKQRDFPAIAGTSKMGIHLRFGTISIRHLLQKALQLNETYLNELIWRDFYQMILWHFPQVAKDKAFKPQYDAIKWRNNEAEFQQWCAGQTGYPIVDAGMRELNTTGFMHNRVRMIVASFLTKHLLIDWRWGEAYFAEKLLDFDFAANNGGWQWAAGSGCDAAPYFRIFNPYLQTKKFDPELKYIKKWVPEFQELTYPKRIVEHEFARKRCLEVYKEALK